jgi:hypothetical protein
MTGIKCVFPFVQSFVCGWAVVVVGEVVGGAGRCSSSTSWSPGLQTLVEAVDLT